MVLSGARALTLLETNYKALVFDLENKTNDGNEIENKQNNI